MANGKKYNLHVEQKGETWLAQIIRQVTSSKTHVTKEQDDFTTQADAQEWAEKELAAFSATLNTSNKRHAEQRKSNEETRRQRSNRRAEKTAHTKSEVLKQAANDSAESE